MKPIVGNKSIEVIEKSSFKESSLPFQPIMTIEDISQLSQSDLEIHLTVVYKALQRSFSPAAQSSLASVATSTILNERIQLLNYLFSIASSAEVGD